MSLNDLMSTISGTENSFDLLNCKKKLTKKQKEFFHSFIVRSMLSDFTSYKDLLIESLPDDYKGAFTEADIFRLLEADDGLKKTSALFGAGVMECLGDDFTFAQIKKIMDFLVAEDTCSVAAVCSGVFSREDVSGAVKNTQAQVIADVLTKYKEDNGL